MKKQIGFAAVCVVGICLGTFALDKFRATPAAPAPPAGPPTVVAQAPTSTPAPPPVVEPPPVVRTPTPQPPAPPPPPTKEARQKMILSKVLDAAVAPTFDGARVLLMQVQPNDIEDGDLASLYAISCHFVTFCKEVGIPRDANASYGDIISSLNYASILAQLTKDGYANAPSKAAQLVGEALELKGDIDVYDRLARKLISRYGHLNKAAHGAKDHVPEDGKFMMSINAIYPEWLVPDTVLEDLTVKLHGDMAAVHEIFKMFSERAGKLPGVRVSNIVDRPGKEEIEFVVAGPYGRVMADLTATCIKNQVIVSTETETFRKFMKPV